MAEPAWVEDQPALVVEKIPGQSGCTEPPLVLLHGWGCDSRMWGGFPQALINAFEPDRQRDILLINLPGFGGSGLPTPFTLEAVLAMFAEALPARSVLIGWSLGGMIATAFAALYPDRVERLICLGANASYIQREGWVEAVPAENLAEFRRQLADNPGRCIKRFRAQQVFGDASEKALMPALLKLPVEAVNSNWHTALELLAEIDNRHDIEKLDVRALYLFGERDSLVPASVSKSLARLNSHIATQVLPGVAHVLHLAEQEKLASIIRDFIEPGPPARDKHQVALSFSRSAATYDQAAYLQRATGNKLLEKVLAIQAGNPLVLDLGCGTGHFLNLLAEKLPGAQVLGLDLAEGMLQFIQRRSMKSRSGTSTEQKLLCGDAEQLPLADNAVDLLFSNFSIQWCNDQQTVAREIYRVLKPGGTALVSTLGPETLHQLRSAWHVVDGYVHVNQFQPLDELQGHFKAMPFENVECEVESTHTEYPSLLLLLKELKALGARNLNQGRPTTLTGKGRIQRLAQAYEQFRPAPGEQLPASWQVIYLKLVKSL